MLKNKRIEILSPAGNKETLTAALNTGADAVYLGLNDFSARKNAENFTSEQLSEAIALCHASGVRGYLALNTLIFDDEFEKLERCVYPFLTGKNRVDAIIVQDLGLFSFIREIAPDTVFHASTQMTVTSVSGAEILKDLGFKRVVLARELSFQEIKEIAKSVDVETEVFIHGALCTSVSGQCYMSSVFGGRSGNRGLCAQPCRLDFSAEGKSHVLSLKDLSLIEHINDLEKAGVNSIKIEGRMKRPEYVAAVTNACYTVRKSGSLDNAVKEQLKSVFSRSGFTEGYFSGDMKDMGGIRTKDDVVSAKPELLENLKKLYSKPFKRFVLDIEITIEKERQIICKGSSEKGATVLFFPPAEKAAVKSLNTETIVTQLSKLGDTTYTAGKIDCKIDDGLWLSLSRLNEIRRGLVSVMDDKDF